MPMPVTVTGTVGGDPGERTHRAGAETIEWMHVGDQQPPARAQHPEHVTQRDLSLILRDVVHHERRGHHVE